MSQQTAFEWGAEVAGAVPVFVRPNAAETVGRCYPGIDNHRWVEWQQNRVVFWVYPEPVPPPEGFACSGPCYQVAERSLRELAPHLDAQKPRFVCYHQVEIGD